MVDLNDYNQPSDETDSWDAALQRQEQARLRDAELARNAAMAQQINAGRAVMNGYERMGAQYAGEVRRRQQMAARHLLSAFKFAAYSPNGRAPSFMMPGLTDALGFDGKTSAVGGAFVDRDGRMGLMVASKDPQTGQVVPQLKDFTFKQMYNMALENPGIFTRDELMRLRNNSITTQKMTDDMANRDLPMVPEGYGEVRTPVGQATPTGGTSVNPNWLYGPRRPSNVSAFGANGRGGFTQYESSDATGHRLQSQDFGTRAQTTPRFRLLSSGADGKRYENLQTGEVITVAPGQTINSVSTGASEKERIAKITANGKLAAEEMKDRREREIADAKNQTQLAVAEAKGSGARTQPKFDPKAYSALKDDYTELTIDEDGNKRELSPADQKKAEMIRAKMDEMLGIEVPPEDEHDNNTIEFLDKTRRLFGLDDTSEGGAQSASQTGNITPEGAAQRLAQRMAVRKAQARGGGQHDANRGQVVVNKSAEEISGRNAEPQQEGHAQARGSSAEQSRIPVTMSDVARNFEDYLQNMPAGQENDEDADGNLTAEQIVQKHNAGNPQKKVDEKERELRAAEIARIKEMTSLGGSVTDERNGKRHVHIANWDYLPDDVKEQFPEYSKKLTDEIVEVQRRANEEKRKWEEEWGDNSEWARKELEEINRRAYKRHPDNTEKRRRYRDKKIEQMKAKRRQQNPEARREDERIMLNSPVNYLPF